MAISGYSRLPLGTSGEGAEGNLVTRIVGSRASGYVPLAGVRRWTFPVTNSDDINLWPCLWLSNENKVRRQPIRQEAAASPTEVLSGVALTTEGAPHGACLNAYPRPSLLPSLCMCVREIRSRVCARRYACRLDLANVHRAACFHGAWCTLCAQPADAGTASKAKASAHVVSCPLI